MENIPLSKKTVVVLKKELAQKTEALNKALKRENELKVLYSFITWEIVFISCLLTGATMSI